MKKRKDGGLSFVHRLWFRQCRITYHFFGDQEGNDSKQEHHREGADTCVNTFADLADQRDDGYANQGCAFSAYVINSEVRAGLFRRDDLGKIGAGERLDRALEHANAYGKNGSHTSFNDNESG